MSFSLRDNATVDRAGAIEMSSLLKKKEARRTLLHWLPVVAVGNRKDKLERRSRDNRDHVIGADVLDKNDSNPLAVSLLYPSRTTQSYYYDPSLEHGTATDLYDRREDMTWAGRQAIPESVGQ